MRPSSHRTSLLLMYFNHHVSRVVFVRTQIGSNLASLSDRMTVGTRRHDLVRLASMIIPASTVSHDPEHRVVYTGAPALARSARTRPPALLDSASHLRYSAACVNVLFVSAFSQALVIGCECTQPTRPPCLLPSLRRVSRDVKSASSNSSSFGRAL